MQVLSVSAVLYSLYLCICFADAQQECPPDALCSSNGTCLSSNLRCDGIPDCLDDSDEANCQYNCSLDTFPCVCNGVVTCLPMDYRCDGIRDCPDGSDEDNCIDCFIHAFPCVSNGTVTCHHIDYYCDGIRDCPDSSDEDNCIDCFIHAFPCVSNGTVTCHHIDYYCDGIRDCPDSSDEDNCIVCSIHAFSCVSNGTVTCHPYCDGFPDCPDSSDEDNCIGIPAITSTVSIIPTATTHQPMLTVTPDISSRYLICKPCMLLSATSAITSTVSIIPTATTHQPTSFISDSTTLLTVTPVLVIICVVLVAAIIVVLRWKTRRKTLKASRPKLTLQLQLEKNIGDTSFLERAQLEHGAKSPYALFEQTLMSTMERTGTLKKLSREMIIPSRNIDLKDSLGQGEFGIVYKGHLLELQRKRSDSSRDSTTSRINVVAVKTLKGFFDQNQVIEMLRESIKMRRFDHPNVLNLIGVCLDGGPAPYIVLSFMANGSLLSYLRKECPNLLLGENVDQEQVSTISKRLLDMCIQIAKGMEYLASRKFVHRDLAARNCMMDAHFAIKVADFGLSENTYAKTYFRQGQETAFKLPIKWLALESMIDGVFSEKTDVWAFGVTCWEVHSAGKTPYPGVAPMSLPGLLENGHRLEKPNNAACGGEMYSTMLSCWNPNPEERPPFSELVKKISLILEPLADYMDFSSFALSSQDVGTSPADGANMEIAYECETATGTATEATDDGLSSSVEVSQESAI